MQSTHAYVMYCVLLLGAVSVVRSLCALCAVCFVLFVLFVLCTVCILCSVRGSLCLVLPAAGGGAVCVRVCVCACVLVCVRFVFVWMVFVTLPPLLAALSKIKRPNYHFCRRRCHHYHAKLLNVCSKTSGKVLHHAKGK